KIQERMPIVPVYLFDARVQGQGAAQEIVSGIEYFNLEFPVDVLIIGRGGGSLEDLWCFNEEIVARAVFASRVPVISGVGHEVDVSLADLAADRRAPTPTAAGEMVVPSRQDLLERLSNLHKRLSNIDQWFASRVQGVDEFEFRLTAGYQRYLGEVRHRLERVRGDLNAIRPDRLFAQLIGRLDVLAARFSSLRDQVITRRVEVLSGLHQRLERSSPQRAIALHLERVLYAEERLRRVVRDSIQERTSRLLQLEGKLAVLNPASVLQRGFALVQAKDGKIIRFASDAQLGTDLNVRFTDGEIEVRVAKVSGAGRESSGRDSHHEDDQGVVTSKNAQRDLF
ncbi:MAG: exodeoxyribonuclease VII large subunit, partial [Bdellovibrionales bacterium]|nr:exodeoxyribonuclease VII large subunit [Bdellovibrionales bacterium]